MRSKTVTTADFGMIPRKQLMNGRVSSRGWWRQLRQAGLPALANTGSEVSELPRLIRRNAVAGGVLLLLILPAFLTADKRNCVTKNPGRKGAPKNFATPASRRRSGRGYGRQDHGAHGEEGVLAMPTTSGTLAR